VSGRQSGKQPVLLMSGTEGIGLVTPKEMVLTSGENLDTVSQRDTQQSTGRRWIHNVGKKISLFVHGVADKINLKLITARGHAQMQAQSGDVEITGDQNVRITANKQKLTAAAGEEMLIACAGAYIRLKGGKIDIHCPGNISIKGNHSFSGPASMNPEHPSFPESSLKEFLTLSVDQSPEALNFSWAGMPYKLYANGGLLQEGVMDERGRLLVEHNISTAQYKLELANGVIYDIPAVNEFTSNTDGEAATRGYDKHEAGSPPPEGRAGSSKSSRVDSQNTFEGSNEDE
jgi:type VI secretion system secreted protein VgrG